MITEKAIEKRVLVFANPIAGRGRAGVIAQRLSAALAAEHLDVRVFLEPPANLSDDAFVCPSITAIVIGGDGTLRAVANQYVRRRQTCPPMLMVPLGTANLMGRHLGIRWDETNLERQVLQALRTARVIHLDAASINSETMLLMAGVGIDAQIVHELSRLRGGPIRKSSYALPALMAMQTYPFTPLTVTADDRPIFGPAPAMAFVGNIPEYGTGFPILPRARPDDGVLDVCVLPCASRRQLLELFLHAAAGEHLLAEGVVYTNARRIEIDSPQPVPVQVDGEAAGFTPVHIDLLPTRLPFIVPPVPS